MVKDLRKRLGLASLVWLVLVLLFLVACGGGRREGQVTAAVLPAWRQVAVFEGKEDKQTEPFTIPEEATEWRITWSTRPGDAGFGRLKIDVYRAGGEFLTTAANVFGSSLGSQSFEERGEYYLVVETTQPFKVTVEAKR